MTTHVLQVGYAPPAGGSDVQHHVALALARLGVRSEHLALFQPRTPAGASQHGLGAQEADLKGLRRLRMRRALRAFLEERGPETWIAHRYRVADLLYRTGVPPAGAFLLIHGCGVLARVGRRRRCEKLLAGGWRVLAVSHAVKADLVAAGLGADQVAVLHNALDIDATRARLLPREQARRELGLAQAAVVVGAVGRLIPKKGFDLLLAAAARAKGAYQVALIGAGRAHGELASLARALPPATVHLLGARPDAVRWMPAFDLLCVPSRDEGFGLVALEGMAAQVPVLVSDAGGLPEVVGATSTPLTLGTGDVLATAITDQLAQPAAQRAAQTQAQLARAQAHFGLEAYTKRWATELGKGASSKP